MNDLILVHSADICHHGVKGQSWGKRQYQYEDGSLTPLGREHYGVTDKRSEKAIRKADKLRKKAALQEASDKKTDARYIKAYNNVARKVNSDGSIAKFNEEYGKKNNNNFETQKYVNEYTKWISKKIDTEYKNLATLDVKNNKNYKKAEKIIAKYGFTNLNTNDNKK